MKQLTCPNCGEPLMRSSRAIGNKSEKILLCYCGYSRVGWE